MKLRRIVFGLGVCSIVIAPGHAFARQAGAPLTASELQACATRVKTLRGESPRLNARARKLDQRRQQLQTLRRSQHAGQGADRKQALQRWGHYNAKAATFNKDMAEFRKQVAQLNRVKQTYTRQCAGRPYGHADLQSLPADLRKAMLAGLAGVKVPYAQPSKPSGDPEDSENAAPRPVP